MLPVGLEPVVVVAVNLGPPIVLGQRADQGHDTIAEFELNPLLHILFLEVIIKRFFIRRLLLQI